MGSGKHQFKPDALEIPKEEEESEVKCYTDEETEYSKSYGPKAPYSKPEKPAWFANRNKSGFEIRMDWGDSITKVEKIIHRNKSGFDIRVVPDAKIEYLTQYRQDFTYQLSKPVIPSRENIGKVRRFRSVPDGSLSFESVKKTFDDDANANPTLKYFINLIARK